MNLEQNFFTLLGLEQHYLLDDTELKAIRQRARVLQRQYHPDRLQTATPHEQQIAAQFSAQVNAAVQTMKDPVARAAHMLALAGVEKAEGEHTIRDTAFLIEQMELREQIEKATVASDANALQQLAEQVALLFEEVQRSFASLSFGSDESAAQNQRALEILGKLQFFQKLQQEIQLALVGI